jgi:hypothetical protein
MKELETKILLCQVASMKADFVAGKYIDIGLYITPILIYHVHTR